jgi:hypothetical protein
MDNIKPLFITMGGSTLLIVGGAWLFSGMPAPDTGEVISVNGLHWHPQLTIFVNGEQKQIPANIGLAGGHKPIHTHDDLPVIHLEFQRIVRTQDITLNRFFEAWGMDMLAFGATVTMNVNGEPNTVLGDYVFRDGDKIELKYD